MNRKSLIALAVTLAAAGSAMAEGPIEGNTPFTSKASRAEVQADLNAFKQSRVNPWSTSYNPLAQFRSERTRDQVRAEYLAERDRVEAFNREDSGSAYLAIHRGGVVKGDSLAGQPARVM